jgi:secondary thiamine-phosphate synthase enzyme
LPRVSGTLSTVRAAGIETIASAVLTIETTGEGFFEITRDVVRFLEQAKARDGVVLLYLRHTSASLVIQENADPDVQVDLVTALKRIAPENAGWVHDTEGPDDMPAHVKAMVNGVSLHVPVSNGKIALGTWQGIYLAEHRTRPHQREVMLQFLGQCGVT